MPASTPQIFRHAVALAALLLASTAVAEDQSARPAENDADKNQLVIGDTYVVKIEQGTVSRNEVGGLLKVTDDWLVLGYRKAVAESTRVPWVGDLPYVGALFRTTKYRQYECVCWLPRASANVQSRIKSKSTAYMAAYKIDERKLEDCTQLHAAIDGKLDWFEPIESVALRERTLHFTTPKDGTTEASSQQVPLANVLCVTQRIPVEQPTKKTENPGKQASR